MRFRGLVGRAVTGVRIRRDVRPHLVFQIGFVRRYAGFPRYFTLGLPRGEHQMHWSGAP